jgi:Protein of unknown function (DUF1757)
MLDLFPVAKVPQDQEYSMEMLYLHGIFKGLQVGPLFGILVGLPVALFRKNPKIFYNNVSFSTLLGPGLVSGLVYGRMQNKEFIEFQDRVFRLQRHRNQNLSDYCSVGGMLLGTVLVGPTIGYLAGLGLGSVAGLGAFTVGDKLDAFSKYNPVEYLDGDKY